MESETSSTAVESTNLSHALLKHETEQTNEYTLPLEQHTTVPSSTTEDKLNIEPLDIDNSTAPIASESKFEAQLIEDNKEEDILTEDVEGEREMRDEQSDSVQGTMDVAQSESSNIECLPLIGVTNAKEISTALVAMIPLPQPSSTASSLSSSCFVTPASTPSHSPSLSPRMTQPFILPSPSINAPGSDNVDGEILDNIISPINAHQVGNHGDEPTDPTHHSTMLDIETQTCTATIIAHACSQTDSPQMAHTSSNTDEIETTDTEVQTDSKEGKDVGCNTELQIQPELLERAKLQEQLAHIQTEHAAGVVERNEAKSQQMVAEELARIIQSELVELRQRNVAETTSRLQLENQLGELKVELSSAQNALDERTQRVNELEDTLKGTSLLVRKLEEQNAISLMNRGGIDYMLQAKLADARAQEAEQKLEVAQMELLQSQGEVKRLLDRVGETTRDRSEMVSSKVHNQLLQIADERANTAEQKALRLEKELLDLRGPADDEGLGRLKTSPLSLYTQPSSYTSTLGGYPSHTSTLLPPSLPPSALTSLSTQLPKPSLEPFKLTFSLPSSSNSIYSSSNVSESEKATVPSSTGAYPLPATTTDEHTGLLKPSTILGRVSDKHVMWDTATPTMTSSSPPGHHDEIESYTPSVQLPSLELTTTQNNITPHDKTSTGEDKESSSDWSSSDEEEDDITSGDPLRPSTHSTLQAQWEWRTMEGSESTRHSEKYMFPIATGHTSKKKPPPVAPKPRASWTHTTLNSDILLHEEPSTFSEPVRVSGLNPLSSSFRRPRGPLGRNLPSRFTKYIQQY